MKKKWKVLVHFEIEIVIALTLLFSLQYNEIQKYQIELNWIYKVKSVNFYLETLTNNFFFLINYKKSDPIHIADKMSKAMLLLLGFFSTHLTESAGASYKIIKKIPVVDFNILLELKSTYYDICYNNSLTIPKLTINY